MKNPARNTFLLVAVVLAISLAGGVPLAYAGQEGKNEAADEPPAAVGSTVVVEEEPEADRAAVPGQAEGGRAEEGEDVPPGQEPAPSLGEEASDRAPPPTLLENTEGGSVELMAAVGSTFIVGGLHYTVLTDDPDPTVALVRSDGVTTLTVPASVIHPTELTEYRVTVLGTQYAFRYGTLAHLDLSNASNLETIAKNAFFRSGLQTVDFSGATSLHTIEEGAFSSCFGLTSADISPLSSLTTIGPHAFYRNHALAGNLTINPLVTTVGTYAFSQCHAITSLDLSQASSLVNIDSFAFDELGITSVDFSGAPLLERLGDGAFRRSGLIGTVTITPSIQYIGRVAFFENAGITNLDLTGAAALMTIDDSAFKGCYGIDGTVAIPSSVIRIGDSAFYGCEGMDFLDLTGAAALETIDKYAFIGGISLSGTLTIPESVKTIGNYAFLPAPITSLVFEGVPETVGERLFGSVDYPNNDLNFITFKQGNAPASGWHAGAFEGVKQYGYLCYPNGATGFQPGEFATPWLDTWHRGHVPAIISDPSATFSAGKGGSFQYATSSQDAVIWECIHIPEGVTLDPATGIATVSASLAPGKYSYTVMVSNGFGSSTQEFTLQITPATDDPVPVPAPAPSGGTTQAVADTSPPPTTTTSAPATGDGLFLPVAALCTAAVASIAAIALLRRRKHADTTD